MGVDQHDADPRLGLASLHEAGLEDCVAFCAGIDMTDERWDTRAHNNEEPYRVGAGGSPYKPWHDATMALSGPVAKTLGELCRRRWHAAGGEMLPAPSGRSHVGPTA